MRQWLFIFLYLCTFVTALPEIGHWDLNVPLGTSVIFKKSVFDGTSVNIQVLCSKSASMRLRLSIVWSECADAFADVKQNVSNVKLQLPLLSGAHVENIDTLEKAIECSTAEPQVVNSKVTKDGSQMSILSLECAKDGGCDKSINVHVIADIKSDYGYLSAIEYPLRTFYGILSLGYVLLGFLWLCFTFCHWKDLLRIQYYITLMIAIGLVEQITLYALYESLNRFGVSLESALVFALIVSCLKRTLARFLLLIVCVGYGITKSRLGTAYRRIVWICIVYLMCCLLDAGLRAFHPRFKPSLAILLGGLPMIAVDLAILWWSFSYLLSTLRETRMRRNKVKHRLYRIFSALLIAVAIISIVCMCASIFLLHWKPCTRAWRYIWFDETFWQLLFYVVLFTIVILWRPSSTNRLYARSAFLDPDVEPPPEDLEERLLDAIVSGINDESGSGRKNGKNVASEDEALLWAEENIPPSQESGIDSSEQPIRRSASTTQLKID